MTSDRAPLTKRERAELEGYVAWSGVAVRGALFVLAVAGIAAVLRRIQSGLGIEGVWWLLLTAVVAGLLFKVSARWTGGPRLRALIHQDLAAGTVVVHKVRVVDAIACEENEDEGPTFFLKLDTGETLALAGQYLSRHASRGFPWAEFEIRETEHSRRFLGISKRGKPFEPSLVRPQLSFAALKSFGLLQQPWTLLEVDFDKLREVA